MEDLKNDVMEAAVHHIRNQRKRLLDTRTIAWCITVFACVVVVCVAVVVCYGIGQQQETIREQQYALNAQYAQMMDYLRNIEVTTTEEAYAESSGDGSISVAGDGNYTAGGDAVNDE